MRNLTSLVILLLMLPSCGSNSNQQSIRRNQIAADSLPGYSVQVDSTTIEVFQESKLACEAFIIRADSQYLARAKQIDSVDIEKGFIIACALEGPLTLIEPDGAEINYSIDSTNIYYTKFNVRCVFMTIKGIESVDSIQTMNMFISAEERYILIFGRQTVYRLFHKSHKLL